MLTPSFPIARPGPRTKKEFYERFVKGAFGNHLRVWTYDEFVADNYKGKVAIRFRTASAKTLFDLDSEEVRAWPYDIPKQLASISEQPDNQEETCVINFEFSYLTGDDPGYYLQYHREPEKMKPSINDPSKFKIARRLEALLILQTFCFPTDYDDLMELSYMYPNATIEGSCFKMPVGNCQERNCVIWEIREY